jgi:hypothetical protein
LSFRAKRNGIFEPVVTVTSICSQTFLAMNT